MTFPLGKTVMTQGVAFAVPLDVVHRSMLRFQLRDWGSLTPDDKAINDQALLDGDRILAAYPIDDTKPCEGHGDNTIWIITEADRSVTTILLPEEY